MRVSQKLERGGGLCEQGLRVVRRLGELARSEVAVVGRRCDVLRVTVARQHRTRLSLEEPQVCVWLLGAVGAQADLRVHHTRLLQAHTHARVSWGGRDATGAVPWGLLRRLRVSLAG